MEQSGMRAYRRFQPAFASLYERETSFAWEGWKMSSRKIALAAVAMVLAANASSVHAQSFLERLENALQSAGGAAANATSENVEPGYLGLTGDENEGTGVVVLNVKPGSPAEQAGLKPGDIVTSIDGRLISTLDEMATRLSGQPAGKKLEFEILREGDRRRVPVTLGNRIEQAAPDEAGPSLEPSRGPGVGELPPLEPETSAGRSTRRSTELPPPPLPSPASPNSEPRVYSTPGSVARSTLDNDRPSLGVSVIDLTETTRRQYGLPVARGALITAVGADSPAERAGIPAGVAVVAADGVRIDGYNDLVRYVASRQPGEAIELTYYRGTQLSRRVVRLGGNVPLATPEQRYRPAEQPGNALANSDRPAVRILGQVLGGLANQNAVPPATAASPADYYEMRRQMQVMQNQIDALELRVQELEDELARERRGIRGR
ncbi:MAG: PDZ domain-containing protein [Pirellulaceae bacterium]